MKIEFEGATIHNIADQIRRFLLALPEGGANANVLDRSELMGQEWNCKDDDDAEDVDFDVIADDHDWVDIYETFENLDLDKCPKCGGPADNGHDRCIPPSPYMCTKCNGRQSNGG